MQARVNSGKADRPIKVTIHEFIAEHEKVMKGQVAYATLKDHVRALRFFEKFIGSKFLLSKIKPRHAEAFIAHRLSTVGRAELDKVLANGDHKRGRGRPRKG